MTTTTTTPAAIDYTSRDYAALRESMLTYATTLLPDWKGAANGDPNDFGVVLVELFAYEGDILSYYGDRIANESFLSTATQRGSVLAHAALLDYTPRSATAASTTLQITVTSPQTDVTLPAGFQVSTAADGTGDTLIFETAADVTFAKSDTPITLSVVAHEGQTVTDEVLATSCGDLDAEYTLGQTPVIADSLLVRVVETPTDPGQVWFKVNNLLDAKAADNAYSISLDENDALTVHFGDGVNGRVPPRGAVVHATYRTGGGADGNVEAGTINDIVDETDIVYPDPQAGQPVIDPDTVQPPSIEVTNTQAATGGTDSESLESIRTNAPRALRARERAVSLSDYEALALSVPTVQLAKARAVASVYTNVIIYVAPPGGDQPDQDTLNAVVSYFQPRKLAGVTVVCAGPQYVSIDVELEIVVDPRYSQVSVKQAVRNALQNLLSFENVDFGGRVALSTVYAATVRVDGVTSVVVSKLSRNGATTATDVVLRDNELPIQGSFTLISSGGVVNSGAADDFIGDGSDTVPPQPSGAPSVAVIRCDPNSTHVELSWTSGANTEYWDVVVSYLNSRGEVVQSTIAGPFSRPQATLDLPLIGIGRADNISFFTRGYNGNSGPVQSPLTLVAYSCEKAVLAGGVSTTPTAPPGDVPPVVIAPPPPAAQGTDVPTDIHTTYCRRVGTDSYGEPLIDVRWDWTVPNNPPTRYVYDVRHYDIQGNAIDGGHQGGPQDGRQGFFLENALPCPTNAATVRFFLQVLNADGTLGASSNVATATIPPPGNRAAPNAPTFDSFTGTSSAVNFIVRATTGDSNTTSLIFKELVFDGAGNLLYQSTIGDAAPGSPVTINRTLSSNYGGTPAYYEVQASDISANPPNYGPSSARQGLSQPAQPAPTSSAVVISNLTVDYASVQNSTYLTSADLSVDTTNASGVAFHVIETNGSGQTFSETVIAGTPSGQHWTAHFAKRSAFGTDRITVHAVVTGSGGTVDSGNTTAAYPPEPPAFNFVGPTVPNLSRNTTQHATAGDAGHVTGTIVAHTDRAVTGVHFVVVDGSSSGAFYFQSGATHGYDAVGSNGGTTWTATINHYSKAGTTREYIGTSGTNTNAAGGQSTIFGDDVVVAV